jgi:hypothetical protein
VKSAEDQQLPAQNLQLCFNYVTRRLAFVCYQTRYCVLYLLCVISAIVPINFLVKSGESTFIVATCHKDVTVSLLILGFHGGQLLMPILFSGCFIVWLWTMLSCFGGACYIHVQDETSICVLFNIHICSSRATGTLIHQPNVNTAEHAPIESRQRGYRK